LTTPSRETDELVAFTSQGAEHLARLQMLLQSGGAPGLAVVRQAVAATRSLRGSASLLGLDPFGAFLGRLFQLLEEIESGQQPWSARIESALAEVAAVERRSLAVIEHGEAPTADELEQAEGRLAALRRAAAPEPVSVVVAMAGPNDLEQALQHLRHVRLSIEAQALPIAARAHTLAPLLEEIERLQAALREPARPVVAPAETAQDGLRNHCEGALHHLVEAAAQEVLEEARERGLRLGLRATGVLDPIDDSLGAALLEILAHLWMDCLEVQVDRGEAQIDTVLRRTDHRLIVEIRDGGPTESLSLARGADDDLLGRHPGLRRSRPLVESLHGLVQVEPAAMPGCRFRLSLPLSTERPHAALLRLGRHDVAVPASAVDVVHDSATLPVGQDAAGAFVEVEGLRVPVLHFAFLAGDVSYDELRREHVVVVGSFERRAALFASDARRSMVGRLVPQPQGLWAGTLETDAGVVPMLHVGVLLGRSVPLDLDAELLAVGQSAAARRTGSGAVLVVTGSAAEQERLQELLAELGRPVRFAASAAEAWSVLESEPVDVMLCDLRLPEMNAHQVAERRRQTGRHLGVPMLLVLAQAGEQSHLVVQQLGAAAWVRSPVEREPLLAALRQTMARAS
jgi:CheY-like chemotaxis protein